MLNSRTGRAATAVTKDGRIRSDDADEWLAENDRKHSLGRKKRGY